MDWLGLALLALALVLMMTSGWPTYAVLLGVCTLGSVCGLLVGTFELALLGSLAGRIVGLLEHDLLQALVLYALAGALMHHLDLAGSLYGGLNKLIGRALPQAAPQVAGLALGTLLAPINGSVGASLLTVSKATAAHWTAQGVPPTQRTALVAVASTLGVIVPPSMVLLLLGDAMMRAHTEGLNLARSLALPLARENIRVVNTQDVLQAVLVPGALLLLGWLVIAAATASRSGPGPALQTPWMRRERWAVLLVPLILIGLLTLVALGHVRAVEAAAAASVGLLLWGLVSRQLTSAVLWQVLDDAMALTGALFALLLAATTFSLVLRALGTDRIVANAILALQGDPLITTLVVLLVLLASSFVLDAFELIFLVVPIVMPPLLAQVGDAAWVAALALLVLQAGFLLPPFGYAVVLARGQAVPRPALGPLARGLAPYLAWVGVVIAAVVFLPASTHWLRTAPSTVVVPAMSPDAMERALREMSKPR